MPRTLVLPDQLRAEIDAQDGVLSLEQAVGHGVAADSLLARARRGRWTVLLPGVILCGSAPATYRQRVIAAWLWAGPGSAVDGASACLWFGLKARHDFVHVVVTYDSPARSRGFVVVRRTVGPIPVYERGLVPYVDPGTAVVVAARRERSERDATTMLSTALQRGVVDLGRLRDARDGIGHKWCRGVDAALYAVGVGLRSPAEKDLRDLTLTSWVLPAPLWNQWLDLGDGGPEVCVDSLIEEAALVNEVEGRRYHAWAQQFENMHARHERLTAAGLVVLHPTPTRIRTEPAVVLRNMERTYLAHRGVGLPPNVRLIDPPAWLRHRSIAA